MIKPIAVSRGTNEIMFEKGAVKFNGSVKKDS